MKDFFDTWKFKILVIVAVFLVGIMAYAGANGRLTAAPQELLSVVLTPLQKVTSALSGGAASVWEKYTSIDDVMDRNEQLEAENAELRQQMVDYDRIFNAAGVISRTRENGIITGSADYAADGQCVLTNLDRATEARKGDQVITTGLGGVFPANLLVGTVQEVVPEQSGKSSSAVILPGADPRTVKHVFIITEY